MDQESLCVLLHTCVEDPEFVCARAVVHAAKHVELAPERVGRRNGKISEKNDAIVATIGVG